MTAMIKTSEPEEAAAVSWRFAAIVWAAVCASVLLVFWQTAGSMPNIWWRSATFNHGFLIIPIVAWLVWNRRQYLAEVVPRPSSWGLAAMVGSGLLWVLGWAGDIQIIQQFALIFMIQSSVLAILGLTVTRILLFPLLYLIFCVPFGEELVPPMQDFTAAFVVKWIEWLGIPVYWDGIFISIPTGNFEVAEACSGVRFMIAMLALGVLFANLSFASWKRRMAIMLFVIIVPIIANGFRAFGIVMIAHLSKMEYATGVDHLIYGWFFFAAVMLILIVVGLKFSDRHPDDAIMDVSSFKPMPGWKSVKQNLLMVSAFVLLIAVAMPGYAWLMDSRRPDVSLTLVTIPAPGGGWQHVAPPRRPWKPEFRNIDTDILESFSNGSDKVSVYIGLYHYQRPGAEIVQFGNYLDRPSPWGTASSRYREIRVNDRVYKVLESNLAAGAHKRRVWSLYWVAESLTANRYQAKALTAASRLFAGNPAVAVIAVSVEDRASTRGSEQVLSEFLEQWVPLDEVMNRIVAEGANNKPLDRK